MRALAAMVMLGCRGMHPAPVAHAPAIPTDAGAHPTPVAGALLVVPGETMELAITLRGVAVATVQTAIGRPGTVEGHPAIIIRSRGKTDGLLTLLGDLTWELTSTLDTARGHPISDHEEAWIELAGKKDHSNEQHHWDDDDDTQDIHSVVAAVRGWHSHPGDETDFEVAIGGTHLDVTLRHVARTFMRHTPAIRYDGLVRGELPISAWVSDDTARVPLRVTVQSPWGEIAVDLVDYQYPSDE